MNSGLRRASGTFEAVGSTSERPPRGLLSAMVWTVHCAEIHGENPAENWVEGLEFRDDERLVGQSDERCPERWAESVGEQVKVQTSGQVRVNWTKGSGELAGENPEELSDEHPMLQMTNDEGLMSKMNQLPSGQVVATKPQSPSRKSQTSLKPQLAVGHWSLGIGACLGFVVWCLGLGRRLKPPLI
jgi:hypothetical protein